jgi:hypothetical protein
MTRDFNTGLMSVIAVPLALAGGSGIFLGFILVFFAVVVYSLYTARGSGITQRPYGKIYSGAPGAVGPSHLSGHDERERVSWSRGTR